MGRYFCIPHKMEDKYSSFHSLLSYLRDLEYTGASPYHFHLKKSYQSKAHFFNIYWLLSMMQRSIMLANALVSKKKRKRTCLPSTELQMNNNAFCTMIYMRNDITTTSKLTQNSKLPLLFTLWKKLIRLQVKEYY